MKPSRPAAARAVVVVLVCVGGAGTWWGIGRAADGMEPAAGRPVALAVPAPPAPAAEVPAHIPVRIPAAQVPVGEIPAAQVPAQVPAARVPVGEIPVAVARGMDTGDVVPVAGPRPGVAADPPARWAAQVGPAPVSVARMPGDPTSPEARAAIDFAAAQIGLPYMWGGDGPTRGDAGFDCSGLTTAAYAAAGVRLPRTAHTQYLATRRVTELRPGDLVFYGDPATKTHHVGLYVGNGRMLNAPTFGRPVQFAAVRWPGDDFAGAGRPG